MSRRPVEINRTRLAALAGIRRDAGLTQRQLALRAKRPQSWVAKIETGARDLYVRDFEHLASAYGVSTHRFVERFYKRPEIKLFRRLERARDQSGKATLDPSWQIFMTAAYRR